MEPNHFSAATNALLGEYHRAINDLKSVLQSINNQQLTTIVDKDTSDDDCRSIQTILSHVVRSGYGYAIYIRINQGEKLEHREREYFDSVQEYIAALDLMFDYNVQLFKDYPNLPLEEFDDTKKIKVNWGQLYDVEQLMEHAIVHILRHRRQIEGFILRMKNK